jgi:hypothetical protein
MLKKIPQPDVFHACLLIKSGGYKVFILVLFPLLLQNGAKNKRKKAICTVIHPASITIDLYPTGITSNSIGIIPNSIGITPNPIGIIPNPMEIEPIPGGFSKIRCGNTGRTRDFTSTRRHRREIRWMKV